MNLRRSCGPRISNDSTKIDSGGPCAIHLMASSKQLPPLLPPCRTAGRDKSRRPDRLDTRRAHCVRKQTRGEGRGGEERDARARAGNGISMISRYSIPPPPLFPLLPPAVPTRGRMEQRAAGCSRVANHAIFMLIARKKRSFLLSPRWAEAFFV